MAVLKLQADADKKQAEINKLQAEAIKLLAEAQGVETGHQIALINAQIGAEKSHRDSLIRAAETMLKALEIDNKGAMDEDSSNTTGVPRLA